MKKFAGNADTEMASMNRFNVVLMVKGAFLRVWTFRFKNWAFFIKILTIYLKLSFLVQIKCNTDMMSVLHRACGSRPDSLVPSALQNKNLWCLKCKSWIYWQIIIASELKLLKLSLKFYRSKGNFSQADKLPTSSIPFTLKTKDWTKKT